jgi:hypothetical protein
VGGSWVVDLDQSKLRAVPVSIRSTDGRGAMDGHLSDSQVSLEVPSMRLVTPATTPGITPAITPVGDLFSGVISG